MTREKTMNLNWNKKYCQHQIFIGLFSNLHTSHQKLWFLYQWTWHRIIQSVWQELFGKPLRKEPPRKEPPRKELPRKELLRKKPLRKELPREEVLPLPRHHIEAEGFAELKQQGAMEHADKPINTVRARTTLFCISNVSHWCGLITTHCTDAVPPAAYVSLRDCSLTLCVQVTPFAQWCFNTGQSVHDPGHFQQFRRCLIELAAIHTQRRSQNLVKPAPPPYYCDDIVVLFIVLYCIAITTISCLTRPVAGTTSHTTHRATQLSSHAASLYSLLFSCSTLPLMHT